MTFIPLNLNYKNSKFKKKLKKLKFRVGSLIVFMIFRFEYVLCNFCVIGIAWEVINYKKRIQNEISWKR